MYNTGFGLYPNGGLDMPAGRSLILGESFGSTQQVEYLRPQHSVSVLFHANSRTWASWDSARRG